MFGIICVMHYLVPCLVLQSSCGERASWLLYFNCVLVVLSGTALPRGVVDVSAVCECGISWSYSLNFSCYLRYIRRSSEQIPNYRL